MRVFARRIESIFKAQASLLCKQANIKIGYIPELRQLLKSAGNHITLRPNALVIEVPTCAYTGAKPIAESFMAAFGKLLKCLSDAAILLGLGRINSCN